MSSLWLFEGNFTIKQNAWRGGVFNSALDAPWNGALFQEIAHWQELLRGERWLRVPVRPD